jgi:hypothetical protein
MFGKSALVRSLEKWLQDGGDLNEVLSSKSERLVKTKAEVDAICTALDTLRAGAARTGAEPIRSPLHTLTAFFQQVESKDAFEAFQQDGLPRLRAWVRDCIDGGDVDKGTVMFVLKILAMYRQREDVDLIAQAARMPLESGGFLWSVIFGQFDTEHPYSLDMIDALRNPLPTDFISVAYLDAANQLAISGDLKQHPFNTEAGTNSLEAWLLDTNEDTFSHALSATAALPFIDSLSRERLMLAAGKHPDPSVRMESAWAQAKSGDPAGIERLSQLCLDPRYSYTAQKYLNELGQADRIPDEARTEEFQAVTEMANWLAYPSEFGRPPDSIRLFDTRELFWPPTNDRRRLSLVEYTYNDKEGGEPDRGIGMVGSTTFALFGETTVDLSPEEIYGLHCCWELEMNQDSRAPKKRTANTGRQILAHDNASFQTRD